MINASRRAILVGAAALAPLAALGLSACSTTTGSTTPSGLAVIKGYAASIYGAFSALAPLAEAIDPSLSGSLSPLLAEAQAAEAAISGLTDPTAGASDAQQLLTVVQDGLALAANVPGLPAQDTAVIAAARVLVPTIAGFFGVTPSAPPTAARFSDNSHAKLQTMAAASNLTPAQANAQIRQWLASQPS